MSWYLRTKADTAPGNGDCQILRSFDSMNVVREKTLLFVFVVCLEASVAGFTWS